MVWRKVVYEALQVAVPFFPSSKRLVFVLLDTNALDRVANISNVNHKRMFLRRRAFVMTETELRLIAAPAIIGLSSNPKNG